MSGTGIPIAHSKIERMNLILQLGMDKRALNIDVPGLS